MFKAHHARPAKSLFIGGVGFCSEFAYNAEIRRAYEKKLSLLCIPSFFWWQSIIGHSVNVEAQSLSGLPVGCAAIGEAFRSSFNCPQVHRDVLLFVGHSEEDELRCSHNSSKIQAYFYSPLQSNHWNRAIWSYENIVREFCPESGLFSLFIKKRNQVVAAGVLAPEGSSLGGLPRGPIGRRTLRRIWKRPGRRRWCAWQGRRLVPRGTRACRASPTLGSRTP